MSDADLERELARVRSTGSDLPPSNALPLETEEALEYRNAGNLPDGKGRTLRLVLRIRDASELRTLEVKRLLYEPDFLEAPEWRISGSKAVNVVPLRRQGVGAPEGGAWWEQPEVAMLEDEWRRLGTVGGVQVPAAYRSFVFKTVLSLRAVGKAVTVSSIADSIQRWLPLEDALRIRTALEKANRES